MKVEFLGAAQTVTGSCYMIEANGVRFAVDCGMHQGNKEIEKRNREIDLYNCANIDFFLLTHAHIDHSGLLPSMVAHGFKGPIYCTEPTHKLLDIMLLDSAHIQEMEAEWENQKRRRKGQTTAIEPLYTQADAEKTSTMFSSVAYNDSFSPAKGIKACYRDAGHILGSAFLELEIKGVDDEVTRFVFSGDLGRPDSLLLNNPEIPKIKPDYLFIESTYGDRNHKDFDTSLEELYEAIEYSYKAGGKVVIPAFAVERTQEVIYILYNLYKAGKLPQDMPVFVDSPLAIRATEVFSRYPEYFDDDLKALLNKGDSPFELPNLRYTLSTEESQSINAYDGPCIIISASGMCNAGRVLHHLRHNLWNPKSSVVFVGYQGVGTPGRKMVDGEKNIRLHGEDIAIKARIHTIGGFSAHAGQSQLLDWIRSFAHPALQVVLVHGEEKAQKVLASLIKDEFSLPVQIPMYLEEMTLAPGKQPMVQMDIQRAMPRVNWDILLTDSESKLSSIRERMQQIHSLPWEEQVELRDRMLEINNALLTLLART
ncbi:MBL fold metallo-hydrolase [Desulfovibrio sp. OttesenSCG-928-F07]|nr:MBL fold metallo-hydrolase [Desulfovibrio sp. OttesenSCG-928-F07]